MALGKLIAVSTGNKALYDRSGYGWRLMPSQPSFGSTAAGSVIVGTTGGGIICWRGTVGSEWCHYSGGSWSYKAKDGTFSGNGSAIESGGVVYAIDNNGYLCKYASGAWTYLNRISGTSNTKVAVLGTEIWVAGGSSGSGWNLWQSTDGGANFTNRASDFQTAIGYSWGAGYFPDLICGTSKIFIVGCNESTTESYVCSWDRSAFAAVGSANPAGIWGQAIWANSDSDVWLLGYAGSATRVGFWNGSIWSTAATHAAPFQYIAGDGRRICGYDDSLACLLNPSPGVPPSEVYETSDGATFDAASWPDAYIPTGLSFVPEVASGDIKTDLSTDQGVKRRYFLAIDGVERLAWTFDETGEIPSGFSRPGIICLRRPAERSAELDLGEMVSGLSQMTFELEDVTDPDAPTASYWGKLCAPNRSDSGVVVRLKDAVEMDGVIYGDTQLNANATSVPIQGDVTGFSDAVATIAATFDFYVASETCTGTGVTDNGDGTGVVTGVTKGCHPCYPVTPGSTWGRTYKRNRPGDAGYRIPVSTQPGSIAGRRCALYVTTWDAQLNRWRTETEVDAQGPLWVGRVSHAISWSQRDALWRLSCTSIVDELKNISIGSNMPESELYGINLTGEAFTRTSHVIERDEDGTVKASYDATIRSACYLLSDDATFINETWSAGDVWTAPDTYFFSDLPYEIGHAFYAAKPAAAKVEIKIVGPDPSGSYVLRAVCGSGHGKRSVQIYGASHPFRALGFDTETNPITLTCDVDAYGGWYKGEVVGSAPFRAYHPLHQNVNGHRLFVKQPDFFWADQGDDATSLARVMLTDCTISGMGENCRHYNKYSSRAKYHLNLGGEIVGLQTTSAWVGQPLGEDTVRVKQVYIPTAQRSDSIAPKGPGEILAEIATSTGTESFNGSYDCLPVELSGCVQDDLISVQSFLDMDAAVAGDTLARRPIYVIDGEKAPKLIDLIQREAKLFGWALVFSHGRLRMVNVLTPSRAQYALTLDASNSATSTPGITVEMSQDTVINEYEFKPWDFRTGKYRASVIVRDMDSAEEYAAKRIVIDHPGVYYQGMSDVRSEMQRFFAGRSLRRPSATVKRTLAPYLIDQLYQGDVVKVVSTGIYDLRGSGLRALTSFAQVLQCSWNHKSMTGSCMLRLFPDAVTGTTQVGAPWCPGALVDIAATNAGWNAGTYKLTLVAAQFSPAGGSHDGDAFKSGYKCRVVATCTSGTQPDPAAPQSWDVTVSANAYDSDTRLLALETVTLTGWDGTGATEYVVLFDDYDAATAGQLTEGTWLADTSTHVLSDGSAAGRWG